ncbi:MAG: FtsX-like permease family protein [Acidobacteria bacterium]|nr:MAG: FtsX-like permease family protein [Acidobacteriota bacterium]
MAGRRSFGDDLDRPAAVARNAHARSLMGPGHPLLPTFSRYPAGEDQARLTARLELLNDTLIGESRRPLWMLFTAAGLLLLIACTNVAGLLLGESRKRKQDIAVQAALGASRYRLMRALLAEALVLGIAGTVLGVVFARILTSVFIALATRAREFRPILT